MRRIVILLVAVLSLAAARQCPAGFYVQTRDVVTGLLNITDAENWLQSGGLVTAPTEYSVINFNGQSTPTPFPVDFSFPNGMNNTENYVLQAMGKLKINNQGNYVFRVGSDDGFRLWGNVDGNGGGGTTISEFTGPRGIGNTDSSPMFFAFGATMNVRLVYFEVAGDEELEFSYSVNGSPFKLVGGDPGDIAVTPIPEPGSLVLAATALSVLGLFGLLRRSAKVPSAGLAA